MGLKGRAQEVAQANRVAICQVPVEEIAVWTQLTKVLQQQQQQSVSRLQYEG